MADSNPELIEAWSNNLQWSILTFSIVTLIFIGITVLIFSVGNLTEIAKNFSKYRCNPLMMPFAGQFGYDAKENFQFCISNIMNDKAAEIFAPLYGILSQFVGVLTIMMNATLGIRKLFSNFFLSVNSFIGNVRNKIQNLLLQIRMSFIKMNNLMGRVFGTMFAVIFMGMSALTAANNTANNDLVKFLSEFCFDPSTPVKMADGSYIAIKDIQIDDELAPIFGTKHNPRVTSTFVFNGSRTPMVTIGETTVSNQHFVEYKGEWIHAGAHPSAVPCPSIPTMICLNVTGNQFYVGHQELKVRDYDEDNSPGTAAEAMRIALTALKGRSLNKTESSAELDYSLGFDPAFEVEFASGVWKPAHQVRIGDILAGGDRVVGIVRESCPNTVLIPGGGFVSEAQLVHYGNTWDRAATHWPIVRLNDNRRLIQFVMENGRPIVARYGSGGTNTFYFRDYREVPLPEMETPYEQAVECAPHEITCP